MLTAYQNQQFALEKKGVLDQQVTKLSSFITSSMIPRRLRALIRSSVDKCCWSGANSSRIVSARISLILPWTSILLSCWWMSCFSSEAFSGGSDMPALAPPGRYSPSHTVQPRSPSSRPRSIGGGRSTKRRGRVRPGRAGTLQPRRHN